MPLMVHMSSGHLSALSQPFCMPMLCAADPPQRYTHPALLPVLQVAKCRASIRECVRLCEESQGERPIPPELFDEDGELDEEFIFCCRCTQIEAPEVNYALLDVDTIPCGGLLGISRLRRGHRGCM